MLRISIRSLLAHKMRMAMSVFAVVLGTAFISGALVFGDSLTKILDGAFTGSAVDLAVSPKPAVDGGFDQQVNVPLKDATLATLRAVPGVADAQGTVEQFGVYVLDAKNKVAGGTNSGPGQGLAWLGVGGTAAVSSGAAPSGAGEVVLDERTAEAAAVRVGDPATVLSRTAPAGSSPSRACSSRPVPTSVSRPRSRSARRPLSSSCWSPAPGRRPRSPCSRARTRTPSRPRPSRHSAQASR